MIRALARARGQMMLGLILAELTGCSGACGGAAAASHNDSTGPKDTITIPSGSPTLQFLKIEAVTESDASATVALTGKIGFDEDHTQRVASPLDGRVVRLFVNVGDKVKQGEGLILLSSPQVGQLQSDAQKAEQDLNVATKAVERGRKLRADGAISEKDLAQAEADYKKAASELSRSTAHLRAIGVSASDPTIAAAIPAGIAGTVVERNVLVGQEVRADSTTSLLTISDLDSVWALADVYEQDLGLVEKGSDVAVRVPAYPSDSFPGKVVHVGEVLDPASRTVKLRCSVPNADHRLKPEMFAKLELLGAKGKKVLLIPSTSVLADGEKSRVVIVDGSVFRVRQVIVGPEIDGRVRVLDGLKPGERIVTDGALFLKSEIDSH
jgi:cobalt-zinc-cadmium efflux system membrane fusion protein